MNNKLKINEMYEKIADELNISDSVFNDASNRYESLGEFLSENIKVGKVKIYPQGSMNLGTIIKPIAEEDDYDLDAVCEVSGVTLTARELKKLVGDTLKDNKMYFKLLDKEGKRCWTLEYSEESHFHMDVLPCIPNNVGDNSISITDKEGEEYRYKPSNPKGYAKWFDELQKEERTKKFEQKSVKFSNDVKELRKYNIRTTLQKSVQLLKRHRDIKYKDANDNERDNKPISIIITTLLGRMYTGQENIYELLTKFAYHYMDYIGLDENGNYVISNPVDEDENFADKWMIHPERKKAFFKWAESVKKDLFVMNFTMIEGREEQAEYLKSLFGVNTIKNVFKSMGLNDDFKYVKYDKIPTLTNDKSNPSIKEHTFYGN